MSSKRTTIKIAPVFSIILRRQRRNRGNSLDIGTVDYSPSSLGVSHNIFSLSLQNKELIEKLWSRDITLPTLLKVRQVSWTSLTRVWQPSRTRSTTPMSSLVYFALGRTGKPHEYWCWFSHVHCWVKCVLVDSFLSNPPGSPAPTLTQENLSYQFFLKWLVCHKPVSGVPSYPCQDYVQRPPSRGSVSPVGYVFGTLSSEPPPPSFRLHRFQFTRLSLTTPYSRVL